MHLPGEQRRELFARLAAAVAPGGTLLIVGHHPSDLRTPAHRMHFPDMMFTARGGRGRRSTRPTGRCWRPRPGPAPPPTPTDSDITIHDAVLVARRR